MVANSTAIINRANKRRGPNRSGVVPSGTSDALWDLRHVHRDGQFRLNGRSSATLCVRLPPVVCFSAARSRMFQ